MGLDAKECERHKLPSPEDREAEIGVLRPAQQGGYSFYIYLWWRESATGSPEAVGAVALDLSTKTLRDDIWNRLHHKNPGCGVKREAGNYYFLVLTAPIDLSTRSAAAETLDQLVSDWLAYCESIGGLMDTALPAEERERLRAVIERTRDQVRETLDGSRAEIRALLRPDQQERFDRMRPPGRRLHGEGRGRAPAP